MKKISNCNQTELFELSENQKVPASQLTCNTCEHRQRWSKNSGVFQYCGIRKSKRTDNGLLKIKCKDTACASYKPFSDLQTK